MRNKITKIISLLCALTLIVTSVSLGVVKPLKANAMDFTKITKINFNIDKTKFTAPTSNDNYEAGAAVGLIDGIKFDDSQSAIKLGTIETSPAGEPMPDPLWKLEGEGGELMTGYTPHLAMLNEDGTLDTDNWGGKFISGRKWGILIAMKLDVDAADYVQLDSGIQFDFGDSNNNVIVNLITEGGLVAFVHEMGKVDENPGPSPTPTDPLATFTYDASKETSNFLAAGLVNSKEELFNVTLTGDEQAQVKEGVNASLWLESKDISSSVSSDDKSLVEKALPSGFKTNKYADLNLYKQVGNEATTKISECPGGKVKVALDISSDIKDKNYKIIRLHDGKAEAIEAAEANGKITFETDKFSTYAVAYSDKASTSATQVGGAKTGDSTFVFVIALVAMMAGAVVVYNRKRA